MRDFYLGVNISSAINEICLVLGGDTNPSAETIGRGRCFVLESFVLFYDELYLKAFNEGKKNLFMDSLDTVSLMNCQLLSKALAFIIELFKYVYVSIRKN